MSWKKLSLNNTIASYDNIIAMNDYIHNIDVLDSELKKYYNFGTEVSPNQKITIGRGDDIDIRGNTFINNLTVTNDISFNLTKGKNIQWIGSNDKTILDISCSNIEISGNITINSKVIDLSGDVSFNGQIDALKVNRLIVDDISSNKHVIEVSKNIIDNIDSSFCIMYWKDDSFNIGKVNTPSNNLDSNINYLLKFNDNTTFDVLEFPWSDISSGFIYWDISENKFNTI